MMRDGCVLTKHNMGRGKPHKVSVFHRRPAKGDGPGFLYWSDPKSRIQHASRRIAILEIVQLFEGKQTAPFQKPTSAHAKDQHCFSVVCKHRSLDLETDDQLVRDNFITGVRALLAENHQSVPLFLSPRRNEQRKLAPAVRGSDSGSNYFAEPSKAEEFELPENDEDSQEEDFPNRKNSMDDTEFLRRQGLALAAQQGRSNSEESGMNSQEPGMNGHSEQPGQNDDEAGRNAAEIQVMIPPTHVQVMSQAHAPLCFSCAGNVFAAGSAAGSRQ